MFKRILLAAIVAASTVSAASAEPARPFDRWSMGLDWINPFNSFVMSGTDWTGRATGSFVGLCGGRGFQYGSFYLGADLCVDGGVIETQEHGYAGLNGLMYATIRTGYVFDIFGLPALAYIGAGPDVGLARFGPDAAHLTRQWVGGEHGGLGLEVMVLPNVSVDASVMRRRLSDIQDTNLKDSTWGGLRIKYNF